MRKRILLIALALVALAASPAGANPTPQPLCEDVGTTTGAYWTVGQPVETIPGVTLKIKAQRKAAWGVAAGTEIAFVSVVEQLAPGQYEQHFIYGGSPTHYRAAHTLYAVTVCVT